MMKDEAVNLIWEYMHMNHKLDKADFMLVMGSSDVRVATHAAKLYQQGFSNLIVVSGDARKHKTAMLKDKFAGRTEAEVFKEELINNGVPESKILIENEANNSQENFVLSRDLLDQNKIMVKDAIVVTKPYMERRAYATGKNFWPELDMKMTSPQMTFEEYINNHKLYGENEVINGMVGDLQRIKEYPKKGFQIEQEIPDRVWEAFEYLVSIGCNRKLLTD